MPTGPPNPRRSRLQAPERRRVVLDCAGAAFGERGYEATRLSDIAAAAGVTKPVLYRHFESKTALYLAVLERHGEVMPTFAERVHERARVAEQVRDVLDAWFAYIDEHPYVHRMLFRDSGGGPPIEAVRVEVGARARAVLAEVIDRLAPGAIPADEVEPLAELMSSAMAGLALWWLDNPATPRDVVVDAATRAWAGLLGKP